ncbi:toll/interleukin-1 receptor domain-containing protein [Streptomyces sp. NPDC013178]|uniref:toll/interleukin-1 receptor domain-containing protein n=1 Tax=unclassified Streptomyces TaxID=2593676 RepID=UPI0033E2E6BD
MRCRKGPGDGCDGAQQRVFISHGSKESSFSWEVCEAIERVVTHAGYEVFLDRSSLHQDDGWNSQIRKALAGCDAAVFVLARRALSRPWVRREAEILLQRHDIERIFILVVLLDDVEPEDLEEADLGVLNIKQALKYGAAAEAKPIADDVVKQFAALPTLPCEGTHLCDWVERISLRLEHTDGRVREAAAVKLGLEPREARRARVFNGARFLARTLLNAELGRTVPGAMTYLDAALAGQARKLAEELEPTWVKEEAARAFVPDEGAEEGRTILLNASIQRTAEHHIGRAMRQDSSRYLDTGLNLLQPDEGEATAVVMGELAAALEGWGVEVSGEGEWPDPPDMDVYVILPVESRAARRRLAEVVKEIRDKAPWLHVVVLLEDAPEDDTVPKRWGLEDAVVARPALDHDEERNGHVRVQRMYQAIKVTHRLPESWRTACR